MALTSTIIDAAASPSSCFLHPAAAQSYATSGVMILLASPAGSWKFFPPGVPGSSLRAVVFVVSWSAWPAATGFLAIAIHTAGALRQDCSPKGREMPPRGPFMESGGRGPGKPGSRKCRYWGHAPGEMPNFNQLHAAALRAQCAGRPRAVVVVRRLWRIGQQLYTTLSPSIRTTACMAVLNPGRCFPASPSCISFRAPALFFIGKDGLRPMSASRILQHSRSPRIPTRSAAIIPRAFPPSARTCLLGASGRTVIAYVDLGSIVVSFEAPTSSFSRRPDRPTLAPAVFTSSSGETWMNGCTARLMSANRSDHQHGPFHGARFWARCAALGTRLPRRPATPWALRLPSTGGPGHPGTSFVVVDQPGSGAFVSCVPWGWGGRWHPDICGCCHLHPSDMGTRVEAPMPRRSRTSTASRSGGRCPFRPVRDRSRLIRIRHV